ncbi:MAG: sugar ABC transporter permease [Actinomycetota bacterium]|nr:sugar ABC transporter permease [Actinomycetota bacterium]
MTTSVDVPEAGGRRSPASGAHVARKRRLFFPFFLPAVTLYVLFMVVPTVATVVLAFTSWAGAGDTPQFNAGANFVELASSDSFRYSFLNTLLYIVAGGVGTFVLAFLFTMVLRDMRGGKTVRAILFFPNIVAPLALGMFFSIILIFRPNRQGLVNYLLESVGIDAVKFLAPENVTWVVTACLIWASSGFYITILMAAVDRIPAYLYEDADIAGATPWQKFRNVTLPLTWDVLGVAGVLWTIGAIKIFELVFVLAGPGTYSPPIRAWTLGIYVFDRSFGTQGSPEYGMACAAAVMMIALVSVLVVLLRRLMRRDTIQF